MVPWSFLRKYDIKRFIKTIRVLWVQTKIVSLLEWANYLLRKLKKSYMRLEDKDCCKYVSKQVCPAVKTQLNSLFLKVKDTLFRFNYFANRFFCHFPIEHGYGLERSRVPEKSCHTLANLALRNYRSDLSSGIIRPSLKYSVQPPFETM